jgi:hypothetical protein
VLAGDAGLAADGYWKGREEAKDPVAGVDVPEHEDEHVHVHGQGYSDLQDSKDPCH